ncbi:YoaK family protein [Ramlibacter sp. H39-3-26]|uniref:YoaK family protein n=1 Tax=Curvibacter soli TaxID=3031331 RepID=UPI0023DB67BC|nr:YoaK family protein [Ramlibacter sp. H39-3-26]MDF1486052.1 YoaK family protein [Ramlibacter sp. H39-3-26]
MRFLLFLTGRHRTPLINRVLGLLLAFNAGAVNAGGFLVVHMYTSHMSGFVSTLADNLVLGNMTLVLGALGALLAFTSGAAVTAIMVNWARQNQLRSGFALPLLLEAALMLVFGLLGAITLTWHTLFSVPLTVLLLAFIMGLQNAVVTKMSSAQIRTTHMTGVVTDLGIEIGKMLYWNRSGTLPAAQVRANHARMRLYGSMLGMFTLGGLVGAAGFKHIGFIWIVPLAAGLLALSLPPLAADLERLRVIWRARVSRRPHLHS